VAIRATVLLTQESFTYDGDPERVLRHLLRKLERWNTKEPSADEPPVVSFASDATFQTLPRNMAQMLAHDIAQQHEESLGDLATALQASVDG
jgi:hypothetical protein